MRPVYILLALLYTFLSCCFAFSNEWQNPNSSSNSFVQNRGQFDGWNGYTKSNILYAYDAGNFQVFFEQNRITYRLNQYVEKKDKENEIEKNSNKKEWKEREEEGKKRISSDFISFEWGNISGNHSILTGEETDAYFSYSYYSEGKVKNINHISGFETITYKNLYPGIDVTFEIHPNGGLKYSLTIQPGSDVRQIQMKYDDYEQLKISPSGDLLLQTRFGNIVEHAPLAFYSNNENEVIKSSFALSENTVSFQLENYDISKAIIIDPWVQTPTLSNSNGVWECERDGAGNVYVIGGDMPLKLLKYDPTGALQWTYTTPWDTANGWLGTLATDLAGNSYVTNGSSAALQKINTAGSLVWNTTGGSLDEYWNIAFNCDQTKLIVGGTRLGFFPPQDSYGMIFDINTSNGNVNNTQIVGYTRTNTIFGIPVTDIEEVRSITSSYNARYYFMTLDSIGAIDQNFGVCPNNTTLVGENHGYAWGYKCEDFRPNNGNSGIMSIKADRNFVYTQNGVTVHKRSLATGGILASAAIPGGLNTTTQSVNQPGNSGIDVDTCGNVYIGSGNAVIQFDANLNLLNSIATPFSVFDVEVSNNGDVIVCGATGTSSSTSRTGYVQSFNMGACDPLTLVCCDANICPEPPLCDTDAPVNITPSTTSGTWSGSGITNSSTGTFDPTVSGPGTHTVINSLACGSDSIVVTVNLCATLVVCEEPNGDLTVSGGVGPYNWESETTVLDCSGCPFGNCAPPLCNGVNVSVWTSYSTSPTATPPGTFPIRVTDVNGNTLQLNSTSGLLACSGCSITATLSAVNAQCGQSNGSITATPASGTSPYTYNWDNGQTTQTATGLSSGIFTVTITDNSSCSVVESTSVSQSSSPTLSAASINSTCGLANGNASATVSGGTSPYSYIWDDPNSQTTATATGLVAGNYNATVTDGNGCTASVIVSVANTPGPTVSTSVTNANCGVSDGTATASSVGGTTPYTYLWSATSQTTSTATGLSAGSYSVTVTDNNGCQVVQSAAVNSGGTMNVIISVTDAVCGASDGTATADPSGGTSPYTYNWDDPMLQTTQTASGLISGNFNVTVTDAVGCSSVLSASVNNTPGPSITISVTDANCNLSDGTATATVNGGVNPYAYIWNDPQNQTTSSASGLSAGSYGVTVTDNSGCSAAQTFVINTSGSISLAVSSTMASCGLGDGTATVTPSGGTTPYLYNWNDQGNQTTQTATGLGAGNYIVSVSDVAGCISQTSVNIIDGGTVALNLLAVNESCLGYSDGQASVTVSGGTSPYTYLWNDPASQSTSAASGLSPGVYSVIVSDATGCMDFDSISVLSGPSCCSLSVIMQINHAGCGNDFGTLQLVTMGGNGNYNYILNGANYSSALIDSLNPGYYTLKIVDSSGCTLDTTLNVLLNDPPVSSMFISSPENPTYISPEVVFTNQSLYATNYHWVVEEQYSFYTEDLEYSFPSEPGEYGVCLTAITQACADTSCSTVIVGNECMLFVPNAFTPNGDKINDTFKPTIPCDMDYTFMVFDRWGERIFETDSPLESWDGTANGGSKLVELGVYVWKVVTATDIGNKTTFIGHVTVVR